MPHPNESHLRIKLKSIVYIYVCHCVSESLMNKFEFFYFLFLFKLICFWCFQIIFDVLMSKIIFFKKNIILMCFGMKSTLKNNRYHILKYHQTWKLFHFLIYSLWIVTNFFPNFLLKKKQSKKLFKA